MNLGRKDRTLRLVWLVVTLLCLALPSLWLLASIPPLWRDADGYTQVTGRPGPTTILLHGPLYCFAARLPLYLGHLLDSLSGSPLRPLGAFMRAPSLSDSGVFALLLAQHAALCAAQAFLIGRLSPIPWIRLVLALGLASNPLLYTFAHSVGSEALSAIGVIVLVATGLKIMRLPRRAPIRAWVVLGAVLTLLMLTRQINAMLAALLPLAFFGTLLHHVVVRALTPQGRRRRWRGLLVAWQVRKTFLALGVGLACLVSAHLCIRVLCQQANVEYRSKHGFTFLWRLKFLKGVPEGTRERIVQDAASRATSPESRRGNFTFYFPLTTSIIASILLTLLTMLLSRR